MEKLYTRRAPTVERGADGRTRLRGYAAVYYRADDPGTEFRLNDRFVERIQPGAFEGRLQDDVRALVNHDPSLIIGRTKAGTLRLGTDKIGLYYDVDVPDTQAGRDLVTSVERGDIDGSSFAFSVSAEGMDVETEEGRGVRNITQISQLSDVSPVTYPAYEGTSVSMRAVGTPEVQKCYQAWLARVTLAEFKTRKRAALEALAPGPIACPTQKRGRRLGSLLNNLIDGQVTMDRPREQVIREMGRAAGIDSGTVNQILNGDINCPPLRRLRGFASALGTSLRRLQNAAEADGCEYAN